MKDIEDIKDAIRSKVSLGDMLQTEGFITGLIDEEQLSCPFHGADRKKSARYYRDTDTAYCWVCKEKWDVISYIRKKEGLDFKQVIPYMLDRYHIDITHLPDALENEVLTVTQRSAPKLNDRKYKIEKIRQAIDLAREDLKYETYLKFIYLYMMLKYAVSEDKFDEQFELLKAGMKKVFSNIQKSKGQ